MKQILFGVLALGCLTVSAGQSGFTWKHVSSRTGDFEPPNGGTEQTSCVVYGNGTLDILGKVYHEDAPRLDIWLNLGRQSDGK